MLLQALLALFLLPARAATIDAAPVEAVGAFLRSPAPDWSSLEGVGRVVRGLDPADPAALQSAKPLVDLLQAEAADILASRPGPAATEAELRASADKLALLNDPAFRNLLAPEQQRRVAAAFWAYSSQLHADVRADVWTPSPLTLAEKIEGISRALDASRAVPAEESAPRLRQAEGVSVEAVAGDVARLPSDCLVSAVQLSGFCHGGINALIARQGREFARQVEAAKPLEDGRTLLAARAPGGKAAFKNVAFVADDMRLPLSEVVFRGLKAADDAGAKTVSLPALRTGWNFGFLEGTYERVVSETVLGLNRFLETARKSVERVSIVVRNNPRLLALFNDVKPADPEREALRKAALSGRGFELAPRPARVPARDLKSPIHRDMLAPWDLGRMLVARAPLRIGSIDDKKTFGGPVASVLNLPIKMPGSGFKIPAELEPMREFLQKIIDYEASVNPRMEEFYAYLTVDHGEVKKGDTHRRPGIHIDGVQGSRYPEKMPPEHTYSASDAVGTVFYAQPFDLRHVDPDRDYIHGELERQADESKAVKTADFGIYHWDSYSAHRADVAEKDTPRTFVRVEFSKKVYDSVGDSVNPLFNYAWPRVSRPIPYELNWHAQPLAKVVYEKGQRANAIGLELEGGVPAGEARRLRRLARARQASDVAPLARALSREPFVKAIRVSDKIPAIHDLVIDYPALDGRAAFPELGRPLDDKTVVEGSRKAGGHQADFLIDYEDAELAARVVAPARAIGASRLSDWDKLRALQSVVNDALPRDGWRDGGNDPEYDRFVAARADGALVSLGDYVRLGIGVCRENALLTVVALRAAGFKARYAYFKVFKDDGVFDQDHALALVDVGGVTYVLDSYRPLGRYYNGHRLVDLLEPPTDGKYPLASPLADVNASGPGRWRVVLNPFPRARPL